MMTILPVAIKMMSEDIRRSKIEEVLGIALTIDKNGIYRKATAKNRIVGFLVGREKGRYLVHVCNLK